MELTFKHLVAMNEVFKRLNALHRTDFVTENKYNYLSKQALNCIVCYILATYAEKSGHVIYWERFPKIAIYRAFQSAYVYYDVPEDVIRYLCTRNNINLNDFHSTTKEIIAENSDKEFSNFVCQGLGTYEYRIYRAAMQIADYIELKENQYNLNMDYMIKVQEVIRSIGTYSDIPGVLEISNLEDPVFKVLQQISRLRNQNRWATYAYNMECSVLGHLFDTSIFAYFMALEKKEDEDLATKMFFMGIFHDIAETWTKDIPSPIKDRIPGFREATEKFELEMLELKFYRVIPDFLAESIKKVMLEEPENEQYKKSLKGADYLSADSECWRQYVAGSKDKYFAKAVNDRQQKIDEGVITLTPVCTELYQMFKSELKRLIT